MELLTSSLLRARHGFSLRTGGVSAPPFDTLNTSFSVGDEERAVRENIRRLATWAGVSVDHVQTAKQVHGNVVVHAADVTSDTEADALWTATPQTGVGVRTADCLPLLMEDGRGRVAAVHAGWRGVISQIVPRALEQLVRQGAHLAEIVVAVGPGIHACCFEVDANLAALFAKTCGAGVVSNPAASQGARPRVDLYASVKQQLVRAGVTEQNIEVLDACTGCDARFFSHRRERGVTGRQLSLIVAP